jgi:hypothetical protein
VVPALRVGGKSVFEITVKVARLGDNGAKPKKGRSATKRTICAAEGASQKTGMSVMFTLLHRVGPVAGLAVALFATVAWIGVVGYTLIKLF